MIIGIDNRTTKNQYKGRGIGNYTRHMIEWLPKVAPSVKIETKDFSRVDVFLQPNFWDGFPIRLWRTVPKVLMIHDLVPLATNRFSEKGFLANFVKGVIYRLKLRNIRKADAILVNSDNTKKDVVKYAGVDPNIVHRVYNSTCEYLSRGRDESGRITNLPRATLRRSGARGYYGCKVVVVPLGVDEEFRTQNPVPRGKRGNYILFVGGVEANKNIPRLLEAFSTLNPTPSTLKLIMPGGQFVNEEKVETKMIKAKVKELNLEDVVEFPGFVPQKDLIELYRRALVFVYPSYYEGFGFPVLEAMACGTPVVSSSASSLPEVGGPPEAGAVAYVDPFDVQSIAEGIKKVLTLYTLEYGKYEEMIQKGLEQASKFSWQTCARETLKVLCSVCQF